MDCTERHIGGELLPRGGSQRLEAGTPPQRPGTRVKVHVTDWNGDGRADLLVGDASTSVKRGPPLTAEEEKEKAEIEPAFRAASRRYTEVSAELRDAKKRGKTPPPDLEKRSEAAKEECARLAEAMQKFRKDETLWHGWVWLYLRIDGVQ